MLPAAVALDADLDTAENHLFATSEINAQLNDITILYSERLGFNIGLTETDVVQKSTRRAFYILDVPASVLAPQLAMLPANHFGLEADGGVGRGVGGDFGDVVTLRVSSYTEDGSLAGQCAVDDGEYQGRSAGSRVLMRDETNRRQVFDSTATVGASLD